MPDSELGPRLPPGPMGIVGSEAIISASMSSTGLGTVLSYMLMRSPVKKSKSAHSFASVDLAGSLGFVGRYEGVESTHSVQDRLLVLYKSRPQPLFGRNLESNLSA